MATARFSLAFVCAVGLGGLAAGQDAERYRFELLVYSLDADAADSLGLTNLTPRTTDESRSLMKAILPNKPFSMGSLEFTVDDTGSLLVNGVPFSNKDAPIRQRFHTGGTGRYGETVRIPVVLDSGEIDYFEPAETEPDRYGLHRRELEQNALAEFIVRPPSDEFDPAEAYKVDFSMDYAFVAGREPLDGVTLNVGPPKLVEDTVDIVAEMRSIDNAWLMAGQTPAGGGATFVFFHVTPRTEASRKTMRTPAEYSLRAYVVELIGELPIDDDQAEALPSPTGHTAYRLNESPTNITSEKILGRPTVQKTAGDGLETSVFSTVGQRPLEAELLSAPRITVGTGPDQLFKVVAHELGGGGGFGRGGKFGGGGVQRGGNGFGDGPEGSGGTSEGRMVWPFAQFMDEAFAQALRGILDPIFSSPHRGKGFTLDVDTDRRIPYGENLLGFFFRKREHLRATTGMALGFAVDTTSDGGLALDFGALYRYPSKGVDDAYPSKEAAEAALVNASFHSSAELEAVGEAHFVLSLSPTHHLQFVVHAERQGDPQ